MLLMYLFNCLIFRFTKNFSPDQLLLNAIKGVGELSNLDINEKVLESVLELPTWLKITSASCNRVVIKVMTKNAKYNCTVHTIHLSCDST